MKANSWTTSGGDTVAPSTLMEDITKDTSKTTGRTAKVGESDLTGMSRRNMRRAFGKTTSLSVKKNLPSHQFNRRRESGLNSIRQVDPTKVRAKKGGSQVLSRLIQTRFNFSYDFDLGFEI